MAAVVLLAAGTTRMPAQSIPTTGLRGRWVSGAIGFQIAPDGEASVKSLGLHAQRDRLVFSARTDILEFHGQTHTFATGILIGVARTERVRAASLSVGPSFNDETGYFDGQFGARRRGPGIAIAVDVALRTPGPSGLGIGFTTFSNISQVRKTASFALQLTAGRWRAAETLPSSMRRSTRPAPAR